MARSWRVPSKTIGLAALLCASLLVRPADASEIFPTNVRPFFSVGPSFPAKFDDVTRGFGIGFGFEAEQSSRVSVLLRVEWYRMRGATQSFDPFFPPITQTLTTVNWSLGARAYLQKLGPVRSYVDGGVGARLVGGQGSVFPTSFVLAGAGAGSRAEPEGIAVTLRIGLSSAGPRRAGFFLDSGLDLLIDNPDRYGLFPVRLGVVFP